MLFHISWIDLGVLKKHKFWYFSYQFWKKNMTRLVVLRLNPSLESCSWFTKLCNWTKFLKLQSCELVSAHILFCRCPMYSKFYAKYDSDTVMICANDLANGRDVLNELQLVIFQFKISLGWNSYITPAPVCHIHLAITLKRTVCNPYRDSMGRCYSVFIKSVNITFEPLWYWHYDSHLNHQTVLEVDNFTGLLTV